MHHLLVAQKFHEPCPRMAQLTSAALTGTVDELEPKGQNQDSPHQNVKVGEPHFPTPPFPPQESQDVFTFTLLSS